MLSQLSRGYGSWTAGYVDPTYGEKKTHPDRDYTLPEIDHDTHVHGVTIGARSGRSTAVSYVSTKKTKDTNSDSVALPKTYTTRKGALQLYVAPFDDEDDSENDEEYDRYALRPEYRIKHTAGQELIDLSLKLGTMGRLAMSVLNFGDQEYDKEQSSISDAKNKAFLKFLHSIDEQNIQNPYIDNSLRPGGDLNTYLQELRSSSSLRNYSRSSTYVPKNREFLELQALLRDLESNSWPSSYHQDGFSDRQSSGHFTRPASRVSSRGGTPGLPSTPRSSYRVLSSKQLTASLKSTSYLGRPSSQFSVNDDDDIQSDIDYSLHSVTSAGLGKKPWTPENSTDELLIDKFFRGSSDDWETDEGNKRRRFKERSFITGSELLSQGRNSQRGEGKHCDVNSKGDGFAQSTGQVMNQITEEVQEEGKKEKHVMYTDGGMENGHLTEHVTHIQQTNEALYKISNTAVANRHGTQHIHDRDKEFVDFEHRNDVSDSPASGDSGAKHVPAVISLQSFNKQKQNTSTNRNGLLFKRRKSLSAAIAFDPEKLKHAMQGPRSRPKSSHAEKTRPFLVKDETEGNSGLSRQHNLLYSSTFTPNMTNWSTVEAETEPAMSNIAKKDHQVDDNDATYFHQRPESEMNPDIYQDETVENEIFDDYDEVIQEEALLRDIKECNEEVEQIEAKADVADTDSDSDSGTYVDEHLIQELIEVEEKVNDTSNVIEDKDNLNETNEADVMINSDAIENETENFEVEQPEELEEPKETTNFETDDKNKDEVDEVADEHSDILSKSNLKLRSKFSTDGESTVNEEADDSLSGLHRDTEGLQVSQTSLGDQADTVHSEPPLTVSEEPNELDKDTKEKDDESQIVSKVTDNEDVNEECMTSINPDEESDDNKTNKSDAVQKNIQPDSQDVADCRTSKDDRSEQELIEVDKENTCSESHEIIAVKISEKKDIEETVSSTHDELIPAETDQENETTDVETSNYKSEEQNYNSDEGQDETNKDSMHVGDECKKENLAQISNKSLAESELDRADSVPVQIGEKSTSSITGNKNSPVKEVGRVTPVEASSIDISGEIETKSVGSVDGIGDGAIGTNIQENKTNYIPTAASITDLFDAVGQSKLMQSGKTEYAVLPPGKRPASPPEKMRIPEHLKEAMDRKTMQSYETLEKDLERMTALVDESLSGPTLEAVGEGLTEEELEIAKQILQKKIDAAKQQLDGKDVRGKGQKKKSISKPQKKGKKKKVEEPKTEEELQREAIREKQALEKQRRDEEVKELQRKIAERRKLLQAQDDAAGAKAKELREQMEKLEQEAEDLQRAEDEARDILQEVRKKQREERDARRKAELERRKQDALDRREREKKELEEKKKKEMEMMEKIADAEMRRRLREEEERKMYEEERLAQERYEAELREAQRLEEEEEEKMRELERQAEEEAMQRLIEEREAAERQRRRLMEEEEVMKEAERLKREQMLLEEQRLAEERQKIEDEEQRRRAREMERLMELRRAEEEAREKLQEELERRRSDALARRDYNLENKLHVDKLRHYQGITRAWTFSYFVKWPRETYEKPIGDGNQRKVKINNPAPKKVEAPASNPEAPAESIPQ